MARNVVEKKVTMSEASYGRLMYDKDVFGFEGSVNDFLCTIIINTYLYIDSDQLTEEYISFLSGKTKRLPGNDILRHLNDLSYQDKGYRRKIYDIAVELLKIADENIPQGGMDKSVFIRETAKTDGKISQIINESDGRSAADILKSLIMKYLSCPMYVRESILCMGIYDTILECIKKKIKCRLTTQNDREFILEPYKIVPGKDEYHYYVTGFVTYYDEEGKDVRHSQSFKLSTLKAVARMKESYLLSDKESSELAGKIAMGAEYTGGETKDYKVYFDHYGLHLYDVNYKDRPFCSKKEDGEPVLYNGQLQSTGIYTFKATEFQMLNYLKTFGYHARPLADNDDGKELEGKLKDFYTKAYNFYK